MKKASVLYVVFMSVVLSFYSCDKNETSDNNNTNGILPKSFSIDIPSSLSNNSTTKGLNEELNGNEVYKLMRAFVFVGDFSAEIIKAEITLLSAFNINKPMDLTYVSKEDNRQKHLVVVENASFEGKNYQYKLTISDGNDIGLQLYWNTNPVKGVSIIQGYNLNRSEPKNHNAKIRIDYSEAESKYQKQMEISIAGLDTNMIDKMDKLKMFVGKNNDVLDVYGDANIPAIKHILDPKHTGGYSWVFTARTNETLNISVAKVAIPQTTLASVDKIFETYSIFNVINNEIHAVYGNTIPQTIIDSYLKNTATPAYFNGTLGFISCGELPTGVVGFTSNFVDLSNLTPYVPNDVNNLTINFGN